MKIGAIVLARLDSRRLPDKALRELRGKPLIQYAFEIGAAVEGIDQTILATTNLSSDDRLARFAEAQGVACIRGAVDDVAGRFLGAMNQHGLGAALRLNGDSPFNRPALLAQAAALFREGAWDLVTNVPGRTYPFGVSAEVIGAQIMRKACATMTDAAHREHVTKFFYDHPAFARTHVMTATEPGMSGVQLAVDDETDFARAAFILDRLREPVMEASLATMVALAREFDARP